MAKDKEGREFPYEMEIISRQDRMIIAFGGWAQYELKIFLEDAQKGEIKDLCIDAAGRNHMGSPVWVDASVIKSFLDDYLEKTDQSNNIISTLDTETKEISDALTPKP